MHTDTHTDTDTDRQATHTRAHTHTHTHTDTHTHAHTETLKDRQSIINNTNSLTNLLCILPHLPAASNG